MSYSSDAHMTDIKRDSSWQCHLDPAWLALAYQKMGHISWMWSINFDSTSICFCDLSFSITHPLRDLLCIEHIPVISRWSVHFLVGLPWHCMIRARLPFLYKNSQAAVNTSFKDTFFRAHSLNAYWGVSKLFSGILPASAIHFWACMNNLLGIYRLINSTQRWSIPVLKTLAC